MSIAYFDSVTSNQTSGGTVALNLPSGVAAGDFAVLAVSGYNSAGTIAVTPSGWTQAYSSGRDLNTYAVFYKTLAAGETSVSVAFSPTASNCAMIVSVYRPSGGQPATFEQVSSATTTTTVPSVTIPAPNRKLVLVQFEPSFQTSAIVAPTNHVRRASIQGNSPTRTMAVHERSPDPTGAGTYGGETANRQTSTGPMLVLSIAQGTPPNPPTLTAPADAVTVNRNAAVTHTWTHSDVDGDPQSAFDIRYRVAGTSTPWTVVNGSGATASYTAPAGRYAGNIEWQVRTYDANNGVGAWSASRTFTALDAGTPSPTSGVVSQLDPARLLALVLHGTGRGNLPVFATADLPAEGAVGRQVYDSTTGQVKVKTDASTATYAPVGALTASGSYTGDGVGGRLIVVGFAPRLVIVTSASGGSAALFVQGATGSMTITSGSTPVSSASNSTTANGFVVGSSVSTGNGSGITHTWAAFG